MVKIEELKYGDKVRNTRTGNIGIVRRNPRPFYWNLSWVEVMVTNPNTGKQFTSFWSLRNIEHLNPKQDGKV